MLHTSVWITCRHPQFKKAIWLVESGGVEPLFSRSVAIFGNDSDEEDASNSEGEGTEVWPHDELSNMLATDASFAESGEVGTNHEMSGAFPTGVDNENNGNDDIGKDMTDTVGLCRLVVKILAADHRFKIRQQVRVN